MEIPLSNKLLTKLHNFPIYLFEKEIILHLEAFKLVTKGKCFNSRHNPGFIL